MILYKDNKKNKLHEHHEYKIRKKKFTDLCNLGFNFPNNFKIDINIEKINKIFLQYTHEKLIKINKLVCTAGRMINQRIMGKAAFIVIHGETENIQIYVTEKKISDQFYQNHFKKWDIGDIIGVKGTIFKTKTGQLSIYCEKIRLLSKSFRPLPEKFHGLSNKEIKYRKRYLDLLSNTNTMRIFQKRSTILIIIRNFMYENKFIEVETPILQNIPGGATAQPFITHHNTLNIDMYLRISPELYLKRLIIGGFQKIYEINKNFRNEGISYKHNPEFTMMEIYMTYANYKDLMSLIVNLLKTIALQLNGSYTIQYQKYFLNFNKPFHEFTMKNAILYYNSNINNEDLINFEKIKILANSYGILIQEDWGIGKILTKIFSITTENKLIEPTFITEYPIEVSPLSRSNDHNNNIADRFELFIGGIEIGNGFSELNNPIEQKHRFLQQKINCSIKNHDNTFYDIEYIKSMEYGMPPTAGMGIGIDRLIMIMTDQKNIRDTILFPMLRPTTN